MVSGEMLHFMGANDPQGRPVHPEFRKFKDAYRASLTPEQLEMHHRSYQMSIEKFGETRPFDQWMDVSRIDQFMGAFLFPSKELSKNFNKQRDFTPEQHRILGQANDFLRGKR
jgi:hypothetical protein